MSVTPIPFFGRFAACVAITVLLLVPATGEEDDVVTTDYKEIPQFNGGWDVYQEYSDGELSNYSGSFIFSGDRFQRLDINRILRKPTLAEGYFRVLESAPGKIQWEVVEQDGSGPAFSLFLSADVALTEWGPTKQNIILVHTPCDFRYSDTDSPEIEGCGWLPVTGEWLQAAHLSGDCSLTLRCYRLVSNMYKRLFP